MSAHNQIHRRAALHRRSAFANIPAGIRHLDPRFSPTATFVGEDPGPPTLLPLVPSVVPPIDNPPPIPTPSVVLPPPIPATTSIRTVPTIPAILTIPTTPTSTSTSTSTSTTSTTPTTTSTIPPATSILSSPVSTIPTSISTSTPTTQAPPPEVTSFVIVSHSLAASSSSSSSVPSPSTTSTSSLSTGAVVGGIAAGIVGVAAVFFAIFFFVRRWRKRGAEENEFNANNFRRSAMLMDEPPTHEDTINRGFNPRPPTMIERRLASPAPTFGTQYGAPGPAGYGNSSVGYGATDNYGQHASYSPGQVMSNVSPPLTASSAQPLFAPSPYGQSAFSPASPISPTVAPYDSAYNDRGELVATQYLSRQPSAASSTTYLTRQPSAAMAAYPSATGVVAAAAASAIPLARQPSSASAFDPSRAHSANPESPNQAQYANYPAVPSHHNAPANDYVDLDRSSVTPFQAAQYAEISRRLNTEVPAGLDTPGVRQFVDERMSSVKEDEEAPPLPEKDRVSPFADPSSPVMEQGQDQIEQARLTPSPSSPIPSAQELEFPAPPSPVHTSASRYRIDSTPPMLPEILVQPRVSVSSYGDYDFPSSVRGSPGPSPLASGFPSGVSATAAGNMAGKGVFLESPLVSRFPATPSPLASSFAMPPSPVSAGKSYFPGTPVERAFHTSVLPASAASESTSSATPATSTENIATARSGEKKRPDTVYTMYDPEDAYGGI